MLIERQGSNLPYAPSVVFHFFCGIMCGLTLAPLTKRRKWHVMQSNSHPQLNDFWLLSIFPHVHTSLTIQPLEYESQEVFEDQNSRKFWNSFSSYGLKWCHKFSHLSQNCLCHRKSKKWSIINTIFNSN